MDNQQQNRSLDMLKADSLMTALQTYPGITDKILSNTPISNIDLENLGDRMDLLVLMRAAWLHASALSSKYFLFQVEASSRCVQYH